MRTLLLALVSFTLALPLQADLKVLFDSTEEGPMQRNWVLSWIRYPTYFGGNITFGYGQPAGGFVQLDGEGGLNLFSSEGVITSNIAYSEGAIYYPANKNSGDYYILKYADGEVQEVTPIASDLGKSEGLASYNQVLVGNGAMTFNLQQGPTSGVDYTAHYHEIGGERTLIAETGTEIPGFGGSFEILNRGLVLSPDGSEVVFSYTSSDYSTSGAFLWKDGELSLLYNANGEAAGGDTYYPRDPFYAGSELIVKSNTQSGATGLYAWNGGDPVQWVDGAVDPVDGGTMTLLGYFGASNGALAFSAQVNPYTAESAYVVIIRHSDGSFEKVYDSSVQDFEMANGIMSISLNGFDGEHVYVSVFENAGRQVFATSRGAENGGGNEGMFWAGYPMDENNDLNTGDWMGWLKVDGDYVYSYSLQKWIYMPEDHVGDKGAWGYIFKPGS